MVKVSKTSEFENYDFWRKNQNFHWKTTLIHDLLVRPVKARSKIFPNGKKFGSLPSFITKEESVSPPLDPPQCFGIQYKSDSRFYRCTRMTITEQKDQTQCESRTEKLPAKHGRRWKKRKF